MKNHAVHHPQSGNAFLYILIAVALFAGLTYVLSRGQDSGDKSILSQAQLQTTAQRLSSYVNQAAQAWLQLHDSGTDLDELDLTLPSDVTFNTAPTIHKLFHPDGGGLLFRDMNDPIFQASNAANTGWHFTLVNADWSTNAGTDLILTYVNLKKPLCAQINQLVTGDATIPTVTVNFLNTFVNGSAPLTAATCSACQTYSSVCVENTGTYAFFNMIEMR